ncbi:MAG: hypothetical protein K5876_03610 [Ruminiclostridium sp.]|nr:hypothetical protein [Ruminiclostridium sp.]
MSDRRCIFCGRLTELETDALFRLPPDHPRTNDPIYADFRKARGFTDLRSDLPGVCGSRSPECLKLDWENGRPVLITKTGRGTDTLICPSCHNELFRDTDSASVCSAVFFGAKDSGKTSLILALANSRIKEQFSPDGKYRYIFNDRLYSTEDIAAGAEKAASGEKPADLRSPAAVYRVPRAAEGGKPVCDVLHDVSAADTADEETLLTALPFAESAEHFVYCLPADKLAEAPGEGERPDILMRRDIFMMLGACRFAEKPPELDIALTRYDLADMSPETASERVFGVFPSIGELSGYFSGVKVYAVSAARPDLGGSLTDELYAGLFG